MHPHILRKIIKFFESHKAIAKKNTALFEKAKKDAKLFPSMDYYHPHAQDKLSKTLEMLTEYQTSFSLLRQTFTKDYEQVLFEIDEILLFLSKAKNILELLIRKIPHGMLDVKRALRLQHTKLGKLPSENEQLKNYLLLLNNFLTTINQEFIGLVQSGDSLENILWNTSLFYWEQLRDYHELLRESKNYFNNCTANLTDSGILAAQSINNAFNEMPLLETINSSLSLMHRPGVNKKNLLNIQGFCSPTAINCCVHLTELNKTYFHLPHHNNKYHFDYNPTQDLIEVGGDCFGQSMMIIFSLIKGEFKWLCPEESLLNYQIEQTRPVPKPLSQETIASAETEVSAQSTYNSIQWSDLYQLFSNEHLKKDSICALSFAQNSYTKSNRSFNSSHIAVVAKLDQERSPYKYILFEKELGLFGLSDEESLEILVKTIMNLYQKMNYSIVKLIKYGEVSEQGYQLLDSFRPFASSAPAATASTVGIFKSDIQDNLKTSSSTLGSVDISPAAYVPRLVRGIQSI